MQDHDKERLTCISEELFAALLNPGEISGECEGSCCPSGLSAYRAAMFKRLWRTFEPIAENMLKKNVFVFIEWPRHCRYWKYPSVAVCLARHRFALADFDGCMYGLTAVGGKRCRKIDQ